MPNTAVSQLINSQQHTQERLTSKYRTLYCPRDVYMYILLIKKRKKVYAKLQAISFLKPLWIWEVWVKYYTWKESGEMLFGSFSLNVIKMIIYWPLRTADCWWSETEMILDVLDLLHHASDVLSPAGQKHWTKCQMHIISAKMCKKNKKKRNLH